MGTVRPQGGFRAEVTVKSSEPPPKPLNAKAKLGLLGRESRFSGSLKVRSVDCDSDLALGRGNRDGWV